jgi:hypothetical protein
MWLADLPVIKYLTSHYVSPYSPAVLPSFMSQIVMAQDLGVKIVSLEGRMMNMEFWALKKEEAMVVDELFTAIETTKSIKHLASAGNMNKLDFISSAAHHEERAPTSLGKKLK